ncbi:MAG: acyl-CoA thioesterase, partial [Bacteroidales bacterium]
LALRKEGIKYVYIQDIFRLPDNTPVIRSTVETVCLVNGRLSESADLNERFSKYF